MESWNSPKVASGLKLGFGLQFQFGHCFARNNNESKHGNTDWGDMCWREHVQISRSLRPTNANEVAQVLGLFGNWHDGFNNPERVTGARARFTRRRLALFYVHYPHRIDDMRFKSDSDSSWQLYFPPRGASPPTLDPPSRLER
eukprot:1187035-Prorocentrum_minimum.AAC.2